MVHTAPIPKESIYSCLVIFTVKSQLRTW